MYKRQEGQVLPLGLAMLAVGMLGAFVLFNTGQVATDKMKLANTADAAAYSGTLWQARALNFQSYSNRAMVANQVSIAQAVSLKSWVTYGVVASENIATVLKPVPVASGIAEGLQRGLEVVEAVMTPIVEAMVGVVDIVNRGLSLAQEAMFVSTFVATPDVIRSVVKETDARFTINTAFSGLGLANNLNQWQGFTDGFEKDDVAAMDERTQMINESRDDFSRERNWKFFNFWFYSSPLLRHQVRREGATKLIRVDTADGIEWEWKAKDTMSLQNRFWTWKGTKRYEVPIAWAEAFANSEDSDDTLEPGACDTLREMNRGDCARFLGINRTGEYLADIGQLTLQGTESRTAMSHYTGVQAYRSLSLDTIAEDTPQLNLKVEVSLPAAKVQNSDALGFRRQFTTPVETPGDRISSISVAEVFYKRADADLAGKTGQALEPANGYNPYWGSRLSPISNADRLLALAARPGGGAASAPNATSSSNGLPDNSGTLVDYSELDLPMSTGELDDATTALISNPGAMSDFETIAAALDSSRLDQFREEIEAQLIEALRDQVANMLAGAISSSMGGHAQSVDELEDDLTQMAENELGELASTEAAQPYIDAVTTATQMAERLAEEFRAIRQTIIDEFQIIYERLGEELRVEEERLEELIRETGLLMASVNPASDTYETYVRRKQTLRDLQREARAQFKEQLAIELMDIVNSSSDIYVMRRKEADYLVEEFLRLDEDEISVPWLEEVEEDDVDE
ncbi:hypothetical protein IMCC3135_22945 [Granulosicoccus antarcticus IMCC3135]|uniref:Putative Flp pilus-assembly TadG-like N-terminal domain-containing protein n=2 Tax=Granulosicoccus TaxID=437504 RepID=A0A2Z2NTL8_9GAMM|nr:hypothetical protein IMCC3135_22945 [Granulosicoccus antarcticus IMCC3135]